MADPSRTASVGDGLDGLKRVGLPASAHQRPNYGLLYWPGMAAIEQFLSQASNFVWGPLFLVPLLLFTGLYLTVRLHGLQFRQLPHALWLGLVVRHEPDAEGDITHFQALMTALAATVGTGNIVGVATAIAAGGPGALFWMWMTGLVGMATKYSEALLSVRFRTTDARGEQSGGPMYFLEHGVGHRTGRWLARAFALFAAAAAFGIGNMVQSNAISLAVANSAGTFGLSVHPGVVGLAVAVLAALVILGGIRSIGRIAGTLVPSMILVYVTATTVILVPELRRDPRGDRARVPECIHRHGSDRAGFSVPAWRRRFASVWRAASSRTSRAWDRRALPPRRRRRANRCAKHSCR